MDGYTRQHSREFGIQLAKGLMQYASEAAKRDDIDAREVVLGAYDYLRKRTEVWRDPPIDSSNVDPGDRSN